MNDVTTLPLLRLQRTRRYLPQSTTEKNVLIINARNSKEIGEFMNNPEIVHLNKYQKYYIPSKYKTKIFNMTIIDNLYSERNQMVAEARSSFPVFKQELNIQSSTNNLVYDMSKWNDIFFSNAKRSISYRYTCETYLEILKDVIRDENIRDFNKTMFIDIEQWGSFDDQLGKMNYLNTPLLILYFALWKFPNKFKALGDVNIILTSSVGFIRVNPALTDGTSFRQLRLELEKMNNRIKWDQIEDISQNLDRSRYLAGDVINSYNLVGKIEDKVIEEIDKKVSKAAGETHEEKKDEPSIIAEVDSDKELTKVVSEIIADKATGPKAMTKRDEELRKKQASIKVHGNTLTELRSKAISGPLKVTKLNKGLVNKNLEEVRFSNFESAYMNYHHYNDIMSVISQMNEAEIPVFIRDISFENTSDEMTFKETMTVQLEDANRVRHSFKVDIPIFVDDKFLYLNGNRKVINKQLIFLPIVKTKEDEVQVVTNYNKIFVRRYGAKLSPKTEKLRKLMIDSTSAKRGNNVLANSSFMTTIEYDELAKNFTSIKAGNFEACFSQQEMTTRATKDKIKVPEGKLLVGFEDRTKPVFLDLSTQMIGDKDLVDYIVDKLPPATKEQFSGITTGKKFLYSRATIMAEQVSLILLLSYCEGLSTVLRRANIKHYFSDKRPKLESGENFVQFADGYLVYDMYPYENSLLMNAFSDIPTKGFNYEEFDSKEAYSAIFETMYKRRNLTSAFDNFYDFMIDPISKGILEDLNLPTDFVGVLLHANNLMADNAFVDESNTELYRLRSNELVTAFLYKAVADAYGSYRRTAYNNNPTKISIKQDHVLKSLLTGQTIEDYSVLNPIVEIEKTRVVSAKGPSGLNLSQAYTLDKRGYDPSMLGNIAMSTSPDGN